jgi:hypothetical protein
LRFATLLSFRLTVPLICRYTPAAHRSLYQVGVYRALIRTTLQILNTCIITNTKRVLVPRNSQGNKTLQHSAIFLLPRACLKMCPTLVLQYGPCTYLLLLACLYTCACSSLNALKGQSHLTRYGTGLYVKAWNIRSAFSVILLMVFTFLFFPTSCSSDTIHYLKICLTSPMKALPGTALLMLILPQASSAVIRGFPKADNSQLNRFLKPLRYCIKSNTPTIFLARHTRVNNSSIL